MVDYHQVFLDIMEDYRKNYSYLAFKKYTIDKLIDDYSHSFIAVNRLISTNKSDKEDRPFIRQLAKVLALFEDGHISITAPDGTKFDTFSKKITQNFDYNITYKRKYLPNGLSLQNKAGAAGFYDDILYIHISTWLPTRKEDIFEIIRFFESTIVNHQFIKKLILDVRSNNGGDDAFADLFLSYLIPEGKTIPVARYLFRLDPEDPKKLGREWIRHSESHPKLHFKGDVAVLIGNECKSATEYLIMGLESLKSHTPHRIVLIGDKTFGSSGNPKMFTHPCGISYEIPSWVCYTSKGELLEGNGIKPDIPIIRSKITPLYKDEEFEAALKFLNPVE